MKNTDTQKYLLYILAAVIVGGAGMFFALTGGDSASTVDGIVNVETGELAGPWTNTLVKYTLITSDVFSGLGVDATAQVYDEQPEEWLNARGDFDESSEFTTYVVVAPATDEILINKEKPGMYYVVLTADGYNTEFMTIEIPDGTGRGDISDYQANPDAVGAELAAVGTTDVEHLEFTLVNDTNSIEKETAILTIDENTEFRGWKVIVNDELGFSTDSDGDGDYDEGIARYELSVGSQTFKIFDPANGVDEFDSNDEFTFDLSDVVADENDLVIKVEIKADTGEDLGSDVLNANNELWNENQGVLSYIKIYDAEGDIFAQVQVLA